MYSKKRGLFVSAEKTLACLVHKQGLKQFGFRRKFGPPYIIVVVYSARDRRRRGVGVVAFLARERAKSTCWPCRVGLGCWVAAARPDPAGRSTRQSITSFSSATRGPTRRRSQHRFPPRTRLPPSRLRMGTHEGGRAAGPPDRSQATPIARARSARSVPPSWLLCLVTSHQILLRSCWLQLASSIDLPRPLQQLCKQPGRSDGPAVSTARSLFHLVYTDGHADGQGRGGSRCSGVRES
jgi:hypothetical protein